MGRNIGPASFLVVALYALALVFRSWSLILALTLTLFAFLQFRSANKKEKGKRHKLDKEEEDALINQWKPDPLVPENQTDELDAKPRIIEGKVVKYIDVDGKRCLNLASNDFLALIGNNQIEEVAKKTIAKYGVGACGPRNFYGTVDVHLELERQLADFLGCEEAILYSYGFATISSAIPAYSKQEDIIYADKGVNFAIQKGIQASKSRVVWFEHNDVEHLESLLKAQAELDKKNPKKAATTRRCIIVEGLYAKTASICPLPSLIELKWKYKVRIFMDESFSFGVLGEHGKGVTEHFGVDVIDVDLISASLENAMATTGGFCAGRSFVIGHQRLSGLGYCFSASLPPLLTTAASEALNIVQERPQIFGQLRQNAIRIHRLIQDAIDKTNYTLTGADISPFKHVGYYDDENDKVVYEKLKAMVNELHGNGIFVTMAQHLPDQEIFQSKPSLKIGCRVDLTSEETEEFGKKFAMAIRTCGQSN